MPSWPVNKLLATCLSLCAAVVALAYEVPAVFYRFPPSAGAVRIETLASAPNGQVWIGTQRGLWKKNSNSMEPVWPDSLGRSSIKTLLHVVGNTFFVGMQSGEMALVSEEHFSRITSAEGNPSVAITHAHLDQYGRLWLGTAGEGVYVYMQNRWYLINEQEGLSDLMINALIPYRHHVLAGTDRGLFLIQRRKNSVVRHLQRFKGLTDLLITALAYDAGSNRLYIGTQERGIFTFSGREFKPYLFSNSAIRQILIQHGYVYWINEAGNVFAGKKLLQHSGVPLTAKRMIADGMGGLWIADANDQLVHLATEIQHVTHIRNKPLGSVQAVTATRSELLWFANADGVYCYDVEQDSSTLKIPVSPETAPVISLSHDNQNRIWAGTFGNGMRVYDSKTEKIYTLTTQQGLVNDNILAISAQQHQVWYATLGGVGVLDISKFPAVQTLPMEGLKKLGTPFIYDVCEAPDGTIWMGTDGKGLAKWDGQAIHFYGKAEGVEAQTIYTVSINQSGQVWAGGADGELYMQQGNRFVKIPFGEELSKPSIETIYALHEGAIICGNGTMYWANLKDRWLYTFARSENEQRLSAGLHAVTATDSTTVWGGHEGGLVRLSLSELRRPAKPELRKLYLFLEPISDTSIHRFSAQDHHISFEMKLAYDSPHQPTYKRAQLIGFDDDWLYPSSDLITYPHLPPGSYTFRYEVSSSPQFTYKQTFTYSFTIEKPLWQHLWFVLACATIGFSVVVSWLRYRIRNIRKKEAQAREQLRFQLDTLQSQVNPHFLFNSFNTLIGIIETNPQVAVDYVEKLSDFFRTILTIKDRDVIPLTEELAMAQTYYYLQKKRFGDALQLSIDLPESALQTLIPPLTLQLLIENALKHNQVSMQAPLQILIYVSNHELIIENKRTPKRKAEPSTGIGLSNIRKRYSLLGYTDIFAGAVDEFFYVRLPLIIP